MKIRVLDALNRPDVLDGSKWMALPLPPRGDGTPRDYTLPQQTLGVDTSHGRQRLRWCDGVYDPRAVWPSHFSNEAALNLHQLLGDCTLVDAPKEGNAVKS